jgi:hypothetical protein
MLALSILGASETLSILILLVLGALSVPVGFVIFMMFDDWSTSRGFTDGDLYVAAADGIDTSLLFCDYVDEPRLASAAAQKGIEPEPDKRERGNKSAQGAEVGGVSRGFRALLKRQRESEEREFFDVRKDPNKVLKAVLTKLLQAGEIDHTVGAAPFLPIDEVTLKMLRDASEGVSGEQMRERLVLAAKKSELSGIATQSPLVLITEEWRVTRVGPVVSMSLQRLGPQHNPYRARYEDLPEPIPMPAGLTIGASFPEHGLLDPVKGRLRDRTRVNAGMLATVAEYSDGRLELDPIAVFGRYG